MKTLTVKRIHVVASWSSLRKLPPKELQSITEMEAVGGILETLKEAIPTFADYIESNEGRTDELNEALAAKEITPEEAGVKRLENQAEASKLEREQGKNEISLEFEDAEFNAFFQLMERLGKNWFNNVPNFLEFRAAMNKTNQQPKQKKIKEDNKKPADGEEDQEEQKE